MDPQNNINNSINNNIINNSQLNKNSNHNTISYNERYDGSFDRNIFHKKKRDYNIFNINPEVEEIPTFTFENDRNIKSYKGRINNKYNLIEQYSKNYLEYMKKFEYKRKTPFSSPYLVFQEKTQGENNNNTIIQNNNINLDNKNLTIDANSYSNPIKENNLSQNSYDGVNNDMQNEPIINKENKMKNSYSRNNILSNSANNFDISSRSGEITNPNYFFQKNNEDYYKYKLEQKKYLDYNYEIIKNRMNKRNKREPDINPYNPINEKVFERGKSDLLHNPILNPINNYSYNKYLEKEVNLSNRYNNNNRYNYSALQQAGNQLLNSYNT